MSNKSWQAGNNSRDNGLFWKDSISGRKKVSSLWKYRYCIQLWRPKWFITLEEKSWREYWQNCGNPEKFHELMLRGSKGSCPLMYYLTWSIISRNLDKGLSCLWAISLCNCGQGKLYLHVHTLIFIFGDKMYGMSDTTRDPIRGSCNPSHVAHSSLA